MRRFPIVPAALLALGCGTTPIQVRAPADAAPAVSAVATRDGQIAFDLRAPSHVAAIEIVYGQRLSALAPSDSSGLLAAGSHAMAFRTISTARAPDPAAPRSASRVVQGVAYEPCVSDPPVRYDPVTIDPGSGGERVMIRRAARYCPAPASQQPSAGAPPPSTWVIVLASDQPIDLEQMAANLKTVGSTGFTPHLLASVAATAMAGHDGVWSASAAQR